MKILIVKTSSLGDIIQTFPLLDYLRCKFPEGKIDWVVEDAFAELLRTHKQVDRVITFESKKWRKNFINKEVREQFGSFRQKLRETQYDLLFDLQGNVKSSFIIFMARAKEKVGFGWKTVHEWPNALFTSHKINPPPGKNIREDYLGVAQGYFKDQSPFNFQPALLTLTSLQQQKLIELFANTEKPTLVCPSSAWSNKCLSESTLIQVLKQLDNGPYWFIWGSPKERESAIRLSLHFPCSVVLERLSLPMLQHVMSRCKLVISMDSLPLHLCATTSTPTLSFFGPSLGEKFAPKGSQHRFIQGDCPYGVKFKKTCPKLRTCETGNCLKGLARISHTFSESSHTLPTDLTSQVGEAVLHEHCPRPPEKQSRASRGAIYSEKV